MSDKTTVGGSRAAEVSHQPLLLRVISARVSNVALYSRVKGRSSSPSALFSVRCRGDDSDVVLEERREVGRYAVDGVAEGVRERPGKGGISDSVETSFTDVARGLTLLSNMLSPYNFCCYFGQVQEVSTLGRFRDLRARLCQGGVKSGNELSRTKFLRFGILRFTLRLRCGDS
nr:hypothetical protein HmN_000956800 [Hymenolepis microstoma]